jgi:radical SAM superfamily enzyme YgiQ (UPF0313 family)
LADTIKILLSDLTYPRVSISPLPVPYGIGELAVYLKRQIRDNIEVDLVRTTDRFYQKIENTQYDIFGFSYYIWNAVLSRTCAQHVRSLFPKSVLVLGGPHIPIHSINQEKYLRSLPEFDFFIEKEGERAFLNLIQKLILCGLDAEQIKETKINSARFFKKGKFIFYPLEDRLVNLDEIGSPYTEGLMDEFLDDGFIPIVENNRGCPFSCAYCGKGEFYHNRVAHHSLDFLRREYEYIARKMATLKHLPFSDALYFADSNTGMYEQDLQICQFLKELQSRYGWPRRIITSTGKDLKEKALECIDLLNGALMLTASVQSTDPEVLRNIKRHNIPSERIMSIAKGRGENLRSFSEIILGLPGDSYEKHLQSILDMMNACINEIRIGQLMILPDTVMAAPGYKEKYQLKTKYRLLTKGFEKVRVGNTFKLAIEYEEICVGTEYMSFDDYVRCRVLGLLVNIFYNNIFSSETFRIFQMSEVPVSEYFRRIVSLQKGDGIDALVQDFCALVKGELFDSAWDISTFIERENNYEKLHRKEIGLNLLYYFSDKARTYSSDLITLGKNAAVDLRKGGIASAIEKDLNAYYV